MDYETKIYLDKLVEAVDKLDSPDWWTICITSAIAIVNATIMVWLGVNQYKLQQQQAKAEEYNRYLSLYIPIQSLKSEIDDFIRKLWYYLDRDIDDDVNKMRLKEKRNYLEQLKKDLYSKVADLELQFNIDSNFKDEYTDVLDKMIKILIQVDNIIHDTSYNTDKKGSMLIIYEGKEDEGFFGAIKDFIPNTEIHEELQSFILLKNSLPNKDLLNKIRQRCNID